MEYSEKNDTRKDGDSVFSQSVKAGKRTYFFDVKTTRNNEHYITITESKKIFEDSGASHYEKHKIFLYQEDFEKFMKSFKDAFNYIKEHSSPTNEIGKFDIDKRFTDLNFEDLA